MIESNGTSHQCCNLFKVALKRSDWLLVPVRDIFKVRQTYQVWSSPKVHKNQSTAGSISVCVCVRVCKCVVEHLTSE